MSTVTVELTLEQLVNAFLKLSPEDQLQVLQAIASAGETGQVSSEAIQFVEEIRSEREQNLRAVARVLRDDYAEDDDLQILTSLEAKDFHA